MRKTTLTILICMLLAAAAGAALKDWQIEEQDE